MGLFFPEWMPLWLQFIIVSVVVIFGLCFLLMPFSVFGLKSRLTYLDHQMEDIQSQLRVLLKRIPDARERLEFKLQPIATGEEEGINRGKASQNSSSEYYATASSAKSRPTRFDPPFQAEETVSVRSNHEQAPQYSTQERLRDRGPIVSGTEQRVVNHNRREEEQIYDPPSKPVKEEKLEGSQSRRRAEPILRWPPR